MKVYTLCCGKSSKLGTFKSLNRSWSTLPLLYCRFSKGPDVYACMQQKSIERLIIPATVVKAGDVEIKLVLALSELTIYWFGADNKVNT